MAFWVDQMTRGFKQGRLEYTHVHDDESEHPTNLQTPSGVWSGTPGVFDSRLKVYCQNCGAKMKESDKIKVI